ncbi:MAG: hypothetical protein CO098_06960 [Bacteroidetes bacterium CG_4_9_14_3_um_filter_41_19]|nr:MAG: hypothetical protein CO098_06960 [Bacteroidetes bacterium CG_4_9_14_3_um_filter_41_19]
MKDVLKRAWLQRVIYAIGLIGIVFISLKNGVNFLDQESSIGISYWFFLVIPGAIALYQLIFNNKYGWFSIMCLYGFYLVWTIINIASGIEDKSDYFVLSDYLTLLLIILLLLLFGYFLYRIRPVKK